MRLSRFFPLLLLPLLMAAAALPMRAEKRGGGFAVRVCGYTPGDTLLTVPASVESIPAYAFADRLEIRTVRFEQPSRLRSIGEYAFLGCGNLRELELPAGVRSLGEGCFRECTELRRLSLPEGIAKVPRFMCEWDEALVSVSLPAGLQDIGSHAFAYCSSLRRIQLPQTLTHIGSNVFSCCISLEEIEFPDRIKELESYILSECTSLRRAKLPANPAMLGELIFSGCRSLRELTAPSPTPPAFDCNSYIFEPDESILYQDCLLIVPAAAESAYRLAPGWRLFPRLAPLPR